MREIKYRGKVDGVWWHVNPEHNLHRWTQMWEMADPETIGQWTGLKDRTGKDIYQDDIIQTMNPYSEKHHASVVWDTAQASYTWMIGETWMLHFTDGYAKDITTPLYPYCQPKNSYQITVIGNRHDDPDLLEQ